MYNLILEIEKKENFKFIGLNKQILNKDLNTLNENELINLFNEILEINYLCFYFKNNNMNENNIRNYKLSICNDFYKNLYIINFKYNDQKTLIRKINIDQIRNNLRLIINHIKNNKDMFLKN